MGTMELEAQTIRLEPDGNGRISLWTTTDDMMRDDDGCVYYEIDVDQQKYLLSILNREYSEGWGRKFLKAFAQHPAFRAMFLFDPENRTESRFPIAKGKITLPELPEGAQEAVTRADVLALRRKGQKARFQDFAQLRSGRDAFSRLTLEAMRTSCGVIALMEGSFNEDTDKAKAYRWLLRGLPDWMAVRKVKTDLEITKNAKFPKKGS